MQSGQNKMHNCKYHNEQYTKPIKSSSKNVTKFHMAWMASGTSTLWLTKEFAQWTIHVRGLTTPIHIELLALLINEFAQTLNRFHVQKVSIRSVNNLWLK